MILTPLPAAAFKLQPDTRLAPRDCAVDALRETHRRSSCSPEAEERDMHPEKTTQEPVGRGQAEPQPCLSFGRAKLRERMHHEKKKRGGDRQSQFWKDDCLSHHCQRVSGEVPPKCVAGDLQQNFERGNQEDDQQVWFGRRFCQSGGSFHPHARQEVFPMRHQGMPKDCDIIYATSQEPSRTMSFGRSSGCEQDVERVSSPRYLSYGAQANDVDSG